MTSEYSGIPNGNDGDGQSPTAVHFADTPFTIASTNVHGSSTIPVPFHPIPPTTPPSFGTTSNSDTASIRTTFHVEEARSPIDTLNLSPVSSLTTRIQASRTERISGPSSGDSYFATQSQLHLNAKNYSLSPPSNPLSTQTSSSSLQSLSEDAVTMGSFQSLGRARSLRSAPGHSRGRRISHSKSSSTANPVLPRVAGSGFDHPVYPEQSFSALQSQVHPTRPSPFLRTRSSHPSQNSLYSGVSTSSVQSRDRTSPPQGARTAGNTPISSPGLFSLRTSRSTPPGSHGNDVSRSDSPHLHPTHLQTPKETHAAEIDYDMFTGNKFINSYEVLEEIGRGENGKVKLARDVENNTVVAVKIVPRYSKRRRLGKLGAPEDRVKKEVAILKKARHPNVVSLLEVIDDPSRHKVYIVLEYVEQGEIVWRKKGLREIVAVNRRRLDREKHAVPETAETWEQDMFIVSRAQRHREHLQERRKQAGEGPLPWSLERGGEPEEGDLTEMPSAISRQPNRSFDPSCNDFYEHDESPPDRALEGSMYGPYSSETYGRKMSVASSSVSPMSSEANWNDDDDPSAYVPTLTLSQAREAFRDTVLGLEFLHFQGIIHRDIKPANLLVASDGHIKISDFGVSYLGKPLKENEEDKTSESDSIALDDPRELARTVGTPAFYAPELVYDDPRQFEGGEDGSGPKITGSLDLWSLGVTLYAMIYGFLPFYEDSHTEEGLFGKIGKSEVFLPKTRLLPVEPSSSSKTTSQVGTDQVVNSNKRLDHEFKVEEVSESARDLIRSLLIKDPARRITIEKIKRHPWVVEGIANPNQWIGETNPGKDGKTKIVVDEKDVSHAVVKRSLVERALSGVSRIAGSFLGRREGRKRATSTITSASASTESVVSASASSDSTVGRERKAKDPRGEEVVAALKASRDGEHPLAQSQTASPEDDHTASYFKDLPLDMKASTTNCTPWTEDERRPRGPERAASSLSTADSTRTVRASQSSIRPLHEPLQQELETSSVEAMAERLGGLFSGARKTLAAPKSQERKPSEDDRAPSSNRSSVDGNPHSSPSVAVSRTAASGDIETPEALQTEPLASEKTLLSPIPHDPSQGRMTTFHQPPESSASAFEHAQDMNQRRQILEAETEAERAASRPENKSDYDCPPSPDDETYLRNIKTVFPHGTSSNAMQNLPSASTIASSSIDDFNSSISQSMSQPSIPSTLSGASSLSAESYLPAAKPAGFAPSKGSTHEDVGDFMSTGETITAHGVPVIMPGRPLEEQQPSNHGNGGDDEDNNDGGDDEVDDDDDSDEGLTFGGPSRRKHM